MMELLRRLILLVCICTSIWLAYLASLSPLVRVRPVSVADIAVSKKNDLNDRNSKIMDTKDRMREPLLPKEKRQPKVSDTNILRVKGKEWEEFFKNVYATHEGKDVGREWKRRVSSGPAHRSAFRHAGVAIY